MSGGIKLNKLLINGGSRLKGEIIVQGSKNAVLPILSATLLTDDECVIHNCPCISDVFSSLEIFRGLGCRAEYKDKRVEICTANTDETRIPEKLMKKMRSSVMFLGPLLAKRGEATICRPGGCRLGERPIDIHVDSLKMLGAKIDEAGDCIFCRLEKVKSGKVVLLYPSVGATENVMMMCAGSGAEVKLINPAREPEIVDLQNFLNRMGADIRGAGSDTIMIYPRTKLSGCEYSVIPDRIVGATYCTMTAMCGGEVCLKNIICSHIGVVTEVLSRAGCSVREEESSIIIKADKKLNCIRSLKTLPYPGFPTDAQPLLSAAMTMAEGTSHISETIFENRFRYAEELIKMGADIQFIGGTLLIKGVRRLYGREVCAHDLRGGAALVGAGLSAEGQTFIDGVEFIDRGYENIESALRELGADIHRIKRI